MHSHEWVMGECVICGILVSEVDRLDRPVLPEESEENG